ncbi:MAG: anhydro-N-acetylmuramic acid kinase, partial [Gemmatimonadota bacterium]|nr:anhydro-N-acetylmuramic acid kinase [Gemmatimonadota bacterium]
MRVVGVMSGTSLDGLDLALVEIQGSHVADFSWRLLAHGSVPYMDDQRSRIHEAIAHGSAEVLCRLHADLGEWIAAAVVDFLTSRHVPTSSVRLIGSHGQTVWHVPPDVTEGRRGSTLQLGDPATVAQRTGIDVVSDFRARDMAVGGHGAPLVPWVDCLLFRRDSGPRCMQNIGGMANMTWVPPEGSEEDPVAFDSGPGNALIDAAVVLMTGGRRSFDDGGALASQGTVDDALLARLMDDPYLQLPPPKSTGRERFGTQVVEALVRERGLLPSADGGWTDLIATLTEFTAASIAEGYHRWIAPRPFGEVVVTGGGARNPVLMERLRARLPDVPFVPGADVLGFHPDVKEA